MGMKEIYDFVIVFIEGMDAFSASSIFNVVIAGIVAFVVFYGFFFLKNIAQEIAQFESTRFVEKYKKFRTRKDSVSSEVAATTHSTDQSTQTNTTEE